MHGAPLMLALRASRRHAHHQLVLSLRVLSRRSRPFDHVHPVACGAHPAKHTLLPGRLTEGRAVPVQAAVPPTRAHHPHGSRTALAPLSRMVVAH